MASKDFADVLDSATCSICKNVYKNPVKISCGHSFCEDCLDKAWAVGGNNETCPVCRQLVDGDKETDFDMIEKMSISSISCPRCGKIVILTEYRRHERLCRTRYTGPSTSNSLGIVNTGPNIYTFPCPYCGDKNFDREDLLRHVIGLHQNEDPKVVCPICKVMPWGNPQQRSSNFIDHMKIRHRFDYERFVDFNQDEDTCLKNTLILSSQQH